MRKETSTNAVNEIRLNRDCGMAYILSVMGGRWKASILGFLLGAGSLRYTELKKKLDGISERMLIVQLKELERDGLINRAAYAGVPPKVEYSLTPKGLSLRNVVDAMSQWGEENRPR
jgi:DNA-binding HxlR family transcriptional regulator